MKEIILEAATGNSSILVGEGLSKRLSDLSGRVVLLVDEQVLRMHAEKFRGYDVISVSQGEHNKTLQAAEDIYRSLIALEADRSSTIVGVGGGLTTDIAGFVASTFLRGATFGFISTTLLGQVDASIGGKNGVNIDGYKNMVGVIKQPDFVWCDLSLLETLDDREYRAGFAEVIKYGAIKSRELLSFVADHMDGLLRKEIPLLEKVISECIQIKRDIVQNDERESGERRLLNYGHTAGHAIERLYQWLHGEAVSIGMVLAARVSVSKGFLKEQEALYLKSVLERCGLPVVSDCDADKVYQTIRKDKKKAGSGLHFVFLRGLGDAFTEEIDLDELNSILHDLC